MLTQLRYHVVQNVLRSAQRVLRALFEICPAANSAFAKMANGKLLIAMKDSFIYLEVEVNFLKNLSFYMLEFKFSIYEKFQRFVCPKVSLLATPCVRMNALLRLFVRRGSNQLCRVVTGKCASLETGSNLTVKKDKFGSQKLVCFKKNFHLKMRKLY